MIHLSCVSNIQSSTSRSPPHFPKLLAHASCHSFWHTAPSSCLLLRQSVRNRAPGSGLRAPGSGLRAPGSGLRLWCSSAELGRRAGVISVLRPDSLAERRSLDGHEVITRFIWQGNNRTEPRQHAVTESRWPRPFNCRALVFVNMYFEGKAQE